MSSSPGARSGRPSLFSSSSYQRETSPSSSSSAPIAIALSTFSRFVNREQSRSPGERHKTRPISGSISPGSVSGDLNMLGLHTTTSASGESSVGDGVVTPRPSTPNSTLLEIDSAPLLRPASLSPVERRLPPSAEERSPTSPSTPSFLPDLIRTTSAPPFQTPLASSLPVTSSLTASPSNYNCRPRARTGTTTPSARFIPLPNPVPLPQPRSVYTPSGPSLQNHIYSSGLLNGSLADVHVGAFSHLYALHRMILGQAGFFKMLLSGGFSEERAPGSRPENGEIIQVEMERPMSRIAFEYILSNLYGGGPSLVAPPWASASQEFPLTKLFEQLWLEVHEGLGETQSASEVEKSWIEMSKDPGVQQATPSFLLTVLATSTYLEATSVQAKVFEMINGTISPWTVCEYLNFALGDGLGITATLCEDSIGLRGLEGVGNPYSPNRSRTATQDSTGTYATSVLSSITSISQVGTEDSSRERSRAHSFDQFKDQSIFVGPEGERVGEACACWLSKWSSEVLAVEEWLEGHPERAEKIQSVSQPLRLWSSRTGGLPSNWVRVLIASDAFFLGSSVARSKREPPDGGTGLDGEFERYCFAKRVVEFRRREKVAERKAEEGRLATRLAKGKNKARWADTSERRASADPVDEMGTLSLSDFDDADLSTDGSEEGSAQKCRDSVHSLAVEEEPSQDVDEEEYVDLFSNGIHYSHLTFAQLKVIASDCSPTTGRPYVPQSVIERALWLSQDFRSRIPTSPSPFSTTSHSLHATGAMRTANPPQSLSADEDRTELGLTCSINPLLDSSKYADSTRQFYLVPKDDTWRLNDGPLPGTQSESDSRPKKPSSLPCGPAGFFSLLKESRLGSSGPPPFVFGTVEEQKALRRFVGFEPYRFSAEFWGVNKLTSDRQRLYSETVFLGGSYYNLYLQKIQRKGAQIGIYLHRQDHLSPFPSPSTPPRRPGDPLREEDDAESPPSIAERTPPPYIDRRKALSAFFSIWCPNQVGTALTKFSSGPDSFANSQSWGWKSSSLRSEEYLGAALFPPAESPGSLEGRFNSLRVTLLFGLV